MRARQEGNLPKAELLFRSSLLKAELEDEAGNPRARDMINDSFSALSVVLREQGKAADAERILHEQLDFLKTSPSGDRDPQKSMSLHNLGLVLFDQEKYDEAEEVLKKAVELRRKYDPAPHRNVAISLLSLGGAYFHRGKVRDAELVALQARELLSKISIDQRTPEDSAAMMRSDHNLALIYVDQKKYDEAEKFYKAAIQSMEQLDGKTSPGLILYLSNYARLLRILKRTAEAEIVEARVESIKHQN